MLNDSILIDYDDLRKANAKLIELEYVKAENDKYKQVISNDSIIVNDLLNNVNDNKKEIAKVVKQRNVTFIVAVVSIITTLILAIK